MSIPLTRVWINGRFLTRKTTGVERVAMGLVKALSDQDHGLTEHGTLERDGCNFAFQIAVPARYAADLPLKIGKIPVIAVGKHDGHLWEQWDLARLPADDWLLNLCNTGPLLRRRQGFMFHDAQVYAIPGNFKWAFRRWYRTMFEVAGGRARFLLTNSEFSRQELVRYTGIPASRWTVMHLGCDHARTLTGSLPQAIADVLPTTPFVLAVSSVSPNKNFAAVVNALGRLGDAAPHCVIVGQAYAKVFSQAQLPTGKTTQLGYVSDEALMALYERALCLVYPSLYEGFGLPPVEAMSRGCPVIVSETSSLPEVCGDAALYCDPHDPTTLALQIARLAGDAGVAQSMSARGRAHSARYTWQAASSRLLEALQAAVRSVAVQKNT